MNLKKIFQLIQNVIDMRSNVIALRSFQQHYVVAVRSVLFHTIIFDIDKKKIKITNINAID